MPSTNIYFLKDPENPFKGYIGKSDNPVKRLNAHFNNNLLIKKTKKNDWIKSLKKKNMLPILEEIDIVPKSEWQYWEIFWIEQFKNWGFELKNGTPGGDGVTMTDEIKNKLRLSHLGKKNGKPSIETIKKIRNALTGRTICADIREKMSIGRTGIKYSIEGKQKLKGRISPMKGKTFNHTEESKQKIRDNAKINPNYGTRGKQVSIETRLKQSKAKKNIPNITSIKVFPIIGISLIDNSENEFNSAYEAAINLFGHAKYSGKILCACRGDIKSSRGYIWKFKKSI